MESETNLQDILKVAPRSLVEVNTAGTRRLSSFCARLSTPGEQHGSESLAKQLFALFDFLLEKGWSFYIIDYINEVCRDTTCTSSNPVEAYVLDGSAVLDWCEAVLLGIKKSISRRFGSLKQERTVCMLATRAEGIELILQALNGMVGYRDKVSNALTEAVEINKGLHVVLWCVSGNFMNKQPKGSHHDSNDKWHRAHQSSSQLRKLYCSEISTQLGLSQNDYPYASVESALQTLFFNATLPLGQNAWRAKSMLFGYFLLSANFLPDLQRFQHHPFSLSVAEVALTEGYVYFDRYRMELGNRKLLEKGLDRFRMSMPAVPFSLLDTLVQMGFLDTALHIWGGQQSLHNDASIDQIGTILKAQLQKDDIPFALDVMREYCQRLSGEARSDATKALMVEILEWGLLCDRMDKVLQLPLNEEEENVFISWVKMKWDDDRCSVCIPMYYLARSKQVEAIKIISVAEREGRIERSTGQARDAWLRVQRAVHYTRKDLPQSMKAEIAAIKPRSFGNPNTHDMNARTGAEASFLQDWNGQRSHLTIAGGSMEYPTLEPPVELSQGGAGFQVDGLGGESGKRKHSVAFGLGTCKRMR